jgi:hypothetical protein
VRKRDELSRNLDSYAVTYDTILQNASKNGASRSIDQLVATHRQANVSRFLPSKKKKKKKKRRRESERERERER